MYLIIKFFDFLNILKYFIQYISICSQK